MSYPYLPVNPCCTDVVINNPCGCSSTITNPGCNNNSPCSTHLTASSTIVYDGPVLPCIVAEPCDTVNVILQKIDEVICNLQTQINYLTNQVNSITNQVIAINSDIINIYNTLDECCSATTTTTSTTTAAPCESFSLNNTGDEAIAVITTDCSTGELVAVVLQPGDTNICVVTDSPLTVPGTVIVTPNGPCGPTTTTTTSSSSTTTTTTTTEAPILVLELIGCCEPTTEYVLYNLALATIPSVFTATNGQPYDLVSPTPIVGVPTVTITDFTNYNTCENWLTINLNCPTTTTTTTLEPTTTTTTTAEPTTTTTTLPPA